MASNRLAARSNCSGASLAADRQYADSRISLVDCEQHAGFEFRLVPPHCGDDQWSQVVREHIMRPDLYDTRSAAVC